MTTMFLPTFKRSMSYKIPKTFKSIIYSSHNAEDCTKVLSVHNYTPKENLDESIVLRTLAFPINPSDINQLQGVYPSLPEKTLNYQTAEPSAIAGNEGLFEIVHLPFNNTSTANEDKLKLGDWVIPLQANQGTWSNYRVFDKSSDLIKVNGLDLYSAATVSVNGVTAYQLVNNYIDWDPSSNEWIVQNAGTSSVSKLVSQIAKAKGIKTLSVIRDRDDFAKIAANLENEFGATKVISESENNDKLFGKETLPKILGSNARIKLALNSVGGKSSSSIARKLDKNALMLTYGGMSKQPVTLPTSLHIFKGLTSSGYWVTELNKKDPSLKRKTIKDFIKLYDDGKIASPKNEIETVTWDTVNMTDDKILQLVSDSIMLNGRKKMVVLNWD
ncbi:enoyl-[acyl-carrier-protein] reductase, mitochondrial [Monosporozyma unispora]|nr:mitochondrial 2-enoyl thioester reductase [Kazachstania unispora]